MKPLLLSYYGDDLTGSTDVMEALSLGGIDTVLFLRIPDDALMARFVGCNAIGLAGTSRSETPEWMDVNLTPAFRWLKTLDASICHYKVCSTFDSSPSVGSIGRAIEIGRRVFEQRLVPVIVGAPQLGRYTVFGHLFAAYRRSVYRIDRHPVMSRHPVTPMAESDLLAHLALQTTLRVGVIDLADLHASDLEGTIVRKSSEADILLLDVTDLETQAIAGKEVRRLGKRHGPFAVGSSGLEYAVFAAWNEARAKVEGSRFAPLPPVARLAAVSGSVSPTTEQQIGHARQNGFDAIPVDPIELTGDGAQAATDRAVQEGLAALGDGRSVVLFTALGPAADRGAEIDANPGARHDLGRRLGDILRRLVLQAGLKRAVVAGGDTSSHALGQLGVEALTIRMPLPRTPGSPLCVAHSGLPDIDGLEIAMKGGQIGSDDYFCAIRDGGTL